MTTIITYDYLKMLHNAGKKIEENNEIYFFYMFGDNAIGFINKHREISRKLGTAVFLANGQKEYWLNNIPYPNINSDEEWLKFQDELIVKDIIE